MFAFDKRARHVVGDTETTGFDVAEGDRIRQIACVAGSVAGGIDERKLWFVDTQGRLSSPDAFAVHRITAKLPEDQPETEVLAEFERFVGASPLIFHNSPFDMRFIAAAYERAGRTMPAWEVHDTAEMGRRRFPGRPTNLDSLARAVGVDHKLIARRKSKNDAIGSKRHDALEDTELTFEVWRHMVDPLELDLAGPQETGRTEQAGTTAKEALTPDLDW